MTAAAATSSGARRRTVRLVRRREQPAPRPLRLGGDALGPGEVGRSRRGVEWRCTASGQGEVAAGRLHELVLEVEPAGGGHLQGGAVVEGEDLGHVLGAAAAALLEPARQGGVLDGAVGPGQLGVGHVADQGVDEEELGLALDGRAAHGANQLLGDEFDESLEHLGGLPSADGSDCPRPEAATDDRCICEQRLALGGEQIEPGGDERADRVGHGQLDAGLEGDAAPRFSSRSRSSRRRTSSSANSGLPPLRSSRAAWRLTGRDVAPRRARMSCPVSSPESGPRATCRAAEMKPAPSPANSSTSCRPVASRRRGTSPRFWARSSRKASMGSSAQCRSSTTSTVGPRAACISRNARQAAKFSSREASSASRPRRGRRRARIWSRPEPSGRTLSRRASVRATPSLSRMPAHERTISERAQKVTLEPKGRQRP